MCTRRASEPTDVAVRMHQRQLPRTLRNVWGSSTDSVFNPNEYGASASIMAVSRRAGGPRRSLRWGRRSTHFPDRAAFASPAPKNSAVAGTASMGPAHVDGTVELILRCGRIEVDRPLQRHARDRMSRVVDPTVGDHEPRVPAVGPVFGTCGLKALIRLGPMEPVTRSAAAVRKASVCGILHRTSQTGRRRRHASGDCGTPAAVRLAGRCPLPPCCRRWPRWSSVPASVRRPAAVQTCNGHRAAVQRHPNGREAGALGGDLGLGVLLPPVAGLRLVTRSEVTRPAPPATHSRAPRARRRMRVRRDRRGRPRRTLRTPRHAARRRRSRCPAPAG